MVLRALLFGLVLSGCGRSELLGPHELDFNGSAGADAARVCPGGTRRTPTVAVTTAWAKGCIDVSYVDELASELPLLRGAMAAWSSPDCTSVCFSLKPWPTRPNTRTILLHEDHGALRPSDGALTVYYGNVPGFSSVREMASLIRRPGTSVTAEDYLSAVGVALGFEATRGVDSAVNSPRATLTEADLQSVCALYPCN